MDIENIREICMGLKGTTEDVKWEHNLVFSIGNKMYCLVDLIDVPVTCSIKVEEEEFDELSGSENYMPAPYMARNKWVTVKDTGRVPRSELTRRIEQSYRLILTKLPLKQRRELGV